MQLKELENYIQQTLETSRFRDYCPNGLQVEGKSEINLLVTGVTANLALIEAAVDVGADAILVHHGWFWKNEDARIVGVKRRRLALLLENNISLFAYHLPLDAHPELGNNVQLAQRLGLKQEGVFGDQGLGCFGVLDEVRSLSAWSDLLAKTLGHEPLVIGGQEREIRRVAWCTGAAQSFFQEAISLGVDAFITGEISEPMVHLSRENEVAYFAIGHHASERYGVQALGEHLAQTFKISHQYIEISSPV